MKINERIKEGISSAIGSFQNALIFGGIYLALIAVANVGVWTTSAGLELILREPKQKKEATFVQKVWAPNLRSGVGFVYGDFKLQDGTSFRAVDDLSVLDGKLRYNSVIPKLEEGKVYDIEIRKSSILGYDIGNSILSAEVKGGSE